MNTEHVNAAISNPRERTLGAGVENENLVKENRKLEQQVQGLVQELASLGNKYEGLSSLLRR